jgi:Fe-S cluster assembly scaffold protein SufB
MRRALNLHLGLGGKYSRLESLSRLTGEGAHSDMLAVSIGDEAQEFDARTLQDHASPHTKSDLLFKKCAQRSLSQYLRLVLIRGRATRPFHRRISKRCATSF